MCARQLVIVLCGLCRWLGAPDRLDLCVREVLDGKHLTVPAPWALILTHQDTHDSALSCLHVAIPRVCPHMTKPCALCQVPLTKDNSSDEHIIPQALGWRKTVRSFICRKCNNESGSHWDNELCEQLKPFCTMLDIKRVDGVNQPVPLKGADGKEFVLNLDASISIPCFIRRERTVAGKQEVIIEAKSMKEVKRHLIQETRKRPHLNVEEILSNATSLREHMQVPLRMSLPLILSGDKVGRSIIKSCLGLAHQEGVSVDDCQHAKRYLAGKEDACFGNYNTSDLLKNRPAENYFHCVCVAGDPVRSQVLAYVEYFGCYRIVARLSSSYAGDVFNVCYAIDPVSGKKLDLDVALEFALDEIPAILANEKADKEKAENYLKSLVATCWKHLMIRIAVENANAQLCVKSNQQLTDEQFKKWFNLVADSLARALLGISTAHALSADDVEANSEYKTN